MNLLRQAVYLLFSLCLIVLVLTIALPEANWWYARAQVERIMRTQPTLQQDLTTLDALADEWDQVIGVTTYLRPLIAATDLAKSISAWDSLLRLLDITYPGAGLALGSLDGLAVELVEQQTLVAQLAELDSAADATGQFQKEPGRKTLIALRKGYETQTEPMYKFHMQAADWSPTLRKLSEDIGGLNQALGTLEHDPNPLNQSVAASLIPYVAPLNDYVGGLSATFRGQAEVLPDDTEAMRQVVDTIIQAEEWEKQIAAPPFDLIGDMVHTNLVLFLGISFVAMAATVVLRFVR